VTELHCVTDLQTQRDGITKNVTELHWDYWVTHWQRAWRNYIKRDGITLRDGFTDTAWPNYIQGDGITQRDGIT